MRNLSARVDALEAKQRGPGRFILIACAWDEDAAARRKGYDPAKLRDEDTVVFINTGVPR